MSIISLSRFTELVGIGSEKFEDIVARLSCR